MTYQTPAFANNVAADDVNVAFSRADITIKKSEFLAFAYRVTSRDEVTARLAELKNEFPDARHHCMGYIIGDPSNTTSAGFDDDGEPSGTAGKPILNVLQHKNIGNCCIIVVRYFGGIKLGAGGLTRAYAQSAQAVIDALPLQAHVPLAHVIISTDFAHEAQVRHFTEKHQGSIVDISYTEDVSLTISLPAHQVTAFEQSLGGLSTHFALQ